MAGPESGDPRQPLSPVRTDRLSQTAHLIGGSKGYLNLWVVRSGFWVSVHHLSAEARVLGMPHLCKEEFQVLLVMAYKRKEV